MAAPSPRPATSSRANPAAAKHYAGGLRHLEARRVAQAIAAFEAALAANPTPEQQAQILFALGNAARRVGHARAAEDFYGRVLTLEPGRREALVNLSNLHRANGRYREAQILLSEALEADPVSPDLWLSLAHVLREIGDLERARGFIAEALRLAPRHALALGSMADLLSDQGEMAEARAFYARALKQAPGDARLRYHQSLVLLSEGALQQGWRDYGLRFKAADKPLLYTHELPAWSGAPLPGKALLLTAEQGLGDQIIFASIFTDAMARAAAARLFIECERRLVPLFARSFPQALIRPMALSEENGVRRLDYRWLKAEGGAAAALPIGDLPRLLRKTQEECPTPHAYLKPDPQEQAHWRAWMESLGPAPRVGVCWRSGKMGGLRAQQYAPLGLWAGFLSRIAGTLVSVQYDGTAEEIAALEEASGRSIAVPPGIDQKNELDRAAALLSSLDVVISAPTAVSALAAGLGVPVLKLTYAGSWLGLGKSSEPLAPSCRIIKPDKPGDWAQVFARAEDALQKI